MLNLLDELVKRFFASINTSLRYSCRLVAGVFLIDFAFSFFDFVLVVMSLFRIAFLLVFETVIVVWATRTFS